MESKSNLLSTVAAVATATLFSPLVPLLTASAMTNMRDASYFNSWIDLDQTKLHDSFKLERRYDSRSRHNGLFGYGWCTPFESRLTKLADGSGYALFECGRTEEILFQKERGGFTASNHAGDRLIATPLGRMVRAEGGRLEEYEPSGRLIGITDRSGRRLSLAYDRQLRLIEIAAPEGAAFRLSYAKDPSRVARVETIPGRSSGLPSAEMNYEYEGFDLVRAQSSAAARARGPYIYAYDRFHNLESVKLGAQTLETISYDADLDRVMSVATSDGCRESYSYEVPAAPTDVGSSRAQRFSSDATRTCADPRVPPAKVRFEFWYGERLIRGPTSEGASAGAARIPSLTRMRTETSRGTTEVYFDPADGHVLDVKRTLILNAHSKGGT